MRTATARQIQVLERLGRGASQGAIAAELGISKPAVCKIVGRLEQLGLVRRARRFGRAVAIVPSVDLDGLAELRVAASHRRLACLDAQGNPDPLAAWTMLDDDERTAIGTAALGMLLRRELPRSAWAAQISDVAQVALPGLFGSGPPA